MAKHLKRRASIHVRGCSVVARYCCADDVVIGRRPGAYDDIPHSASAIRDAYLLGTRHGGLTPEIIAPYAHWIPELKEGTCTSPARLETPFLQFSRVRGQSSKL